MASRCLELFDWTGCVHGRRAGLLVAVSDVRSRLQVGFVAEALVDHLAVDFPPAAVSQELLPCSDGGLVVVVVVVFLNQITMKKTKQKEFNNEGVKSSGRAVPPPQSLEQKDHFFGAHS